jgi:hypothetical protein
VIFHGASIAENMGLFGKSPEVNPKDKVRIFRVIHQKSHSK